jgi:hypothetical protein
LKRTVSAILFVLLFAGDFVVCAGWQASPEARMACCENGTACPMRHSGNANNNTKTALTQSDADRCCASSEQHESAPSSSAFVPMVALAPLPVLFSPLAWSTDRGLAAWGLAIPPPPSHVPIQVLLSVFLI